MGEYETDILQWAEHQATLLRRRATGELVNDAEFDWPNIAEEIEAVGRSERIALASHVPGRPGSDLQTERLGALQVNGPRSYRY